MAYPILKWAGGKRQLIPTIINKLPKDYGTFIEPFFGGGALFFHLSPKTAIINDSNTQLMNVYNQIKYRPDDIICCLDNMQNEYNSISDDNDKNKYYIKKRNEFNNCITSNDLSVKSASLFIFLNKSCFNGLYRENANGLFNTSFGHRKNINTYNIDNLLNIHDMLQSVKILNGDFF